MKSNVLLVALCAAVLASCGAANGASNNTVLELTPTNYVTVTQTPTTLTPTTIQGGTGNPGMVHPEEGTYIIATGDYPANIAVKYNGALTNTWSLNILAPGATIKIPPNWTEPGTAADTTATGTTPSTETTTTIAGGQSACAPGEYTIVAGDYPAKVAKALDTTVDALNAANVGTKGYASFQVGVKIKTPPKANC